MHTWCKVGCCCFAGVALSATAATLQVEKIEQRYPWNGLVDIDYTIAYGKDEAPGVDDNLEVLFVDQSVVPAVTNRAISFLQAPLPLTTGAHRITWDANADGVTNNVADAKFLVKITHYNAIYMVIDVSGGATTDVYPVDFLDGAPTGGFNANEYKGDKIVLRRIHAGSYVAGSPSTEANRTANREKQHRVTLSQPFYIGLFEVTQKQYFNVMGKDPSSNKGDCRPVESMTCGTVRGTGWPTKVEVESASFMGQLLAKCKSKDENGNYTVPVTGFDLPTEFQWEYACRAGTTGAFSTTNEYANSTAGQQQALALLGRYTSNQTDGKSEYTSAHAVVGSYQPNAWGLYDMHGNVAEWVLDRWQEDAAGLKQPLDPVGGPLDSGSTVIRGGAWNKAVGDCRSAARDKWTWGYGRADIGFRVSRTQR